jgi:sulfur-oxidizing protein SoxY
MKLTRRQTLGLAGGAAALAVSGVQFTPAYAASDASTKRMMDFTGGKEPASGKITLTAPEIAENGNTVPITVDVESAMSR